MAEESYPRLISLAVHELRTPANVVEGYLQMLQRDTDPPLGEHHRKLIAQAEKSCARLVEIIAALGDVAKLDEGLVPMSAREIDLFEVVAAAIAGVPEATERQVHVEVRGPNSGALMSGDQDRLRSAFAAIVHAILREKTGPCTVVVDRRIILEAGHRTAVVVVTEAASLQAAYEVPAGTFDEKRGGVGLSLPLARRVIEAHGGRLSSPAVGAGSGAGTFDQRGSRATALVALPLAS